MAFTSRKVPQLRHRHVRFTVKPPIACPQLRLVGLGPDRLLGGRADAGPDVQVLWMRPGGVPGSPRHRPGGRARAQSGSGVAGEFCRTPRPP